MDLRGTVRIDARNYKTAVWKDTADGSILQDQPLFPTHCRNPKDAPRTLDRATEIDRGAIRRPVQTIDIALGTIAGQDRPVAGVRLHDGHLRSSVHHRSKRQRVAIR